MEGGRPHDCATLETLNQRWRRWDHRLWGVLLGMLAGGLLLVWATRMARAARKAAAWTTQASNTLAGLGLPVRRDGWRFLLPSRFSWLTVGLPNGPAGERWGRRAAVVLNEEPTLTARAVDEAAKAALACGSEVALLIHPERVVPDLGAVRSMLEWAARGGRLAAQVLPVSRERLQWAHSPDDLLDLLEQNSLRGNPFEVRGRIASSSQFFNRERLVSGLLAEAAAGRWTLVTGLRRMGKSSLALEVCRRLHGPSAYVDLAGFHDELTKASDPVAAAESILSYLCVPRSLDASGLSEWLSRFADGCRRANRGKPSVAIIVLDEVEQGLAASAANARRALEALEIVVGRLRAALGDARSSGDLRVGVVLCAAIHPLLWAPLATLTGQSLIGAFASVTVPTLSPEAAQAMMHSLGAGHGIRFTPEALDLIIREANGIPLLARRLGSAVLELFDRERALHGGLGALEIGLEGARAAVRRECDEGSPSRVWITSEIGDPRSVVGSLLREAARRGEIATADLEQLASDLTRERLAEPELEALLQADERAQRAREAGGVIVRILQESGILAPVGDLTHPDRLAFQEGLLRRILSGGALHARGSSLASG